MTRLRPLRRAQTSRSIRSHTHRAINETTMKEMAAIRGKSTERRGRKRERCVALRELAMEISETSLGSSQTLPLPHLSTLAARRFCCFSDTIFPAADKLSRPRSGSVVWRRGVRNAAASLYIPMSVRVSLAGSQGGSGQAFPPLDGSSYVGLWPATLELEAHCMHT
jgi:hypothetical protein